MVLGVGQVEELSYEKTYLETDLNTGECRDIAVPSTAKSQLPETMTVSGEVSARLQGVSSTHGFPGQSSFAPKSAAFGYHGFGNSQAAASGYPMSMIGSYSGVRNPPVTGTGFPSDDARKFSSERTEPRSGVYSLASSRPSVQQTASKPGTDAGDWAADRRLGPDAVKIEADYQHDQVVNSRRDYADGIQYSSGRQLAANVPSVPMQVSSLGL